MVSKTKRSGMTGRYKNTRGGRQASDLLAGAMRNYRSGGYKDKEKMTNLTNAKAGRHVDRKHHTAKVKARRSKK